MSNTPRSSVSTSGGGDTDIRVGTLSTTGAHDDRRHSMRPCGATQDIITSTGNANGLSPRVRGNRTSSSSGTDTPRVYPRVCGGTPF